MQQKWNVLVILVMSIGVIDSWFMCNVGILMYGVLGLFVELVDLCMYGLDECIEIVWLYDGWEFFYWFVKQLVE